MSHHQPTNGTTTELNSNHRVAHSNTPSTTLYVQNLCDKLKKQDLRRILYQLFSTHGKVLDVVALKGTKMRGQAFIVFRDLQGATQAMRYLDGTAFLDRDLRITYARRRSYATVRQIAGDEVLYQVRLGLTDPDTLNEVGRAKLTVSGAQAANMDKRKAEEASARKRARGEGSDQDGDLGSEHESEVDEFERSTMTGGKKLKNTHQLVDDDDDDMEEDSDSEQPVDSAAAAAVKAAGSAPVLSGEDPNPVLFLEGLPAEVTDDMMAVLFQQYPGFQHVRLVPGRTGIAFVQYDTAAQSDMAKSALDGFQLAPGLMMKVGFARRG